MPENKDMPENKKARLLIFTGDGKGKTTAAFGMAFRASGHGMKSIVVQFIKSDTTVGEIAAAHTNPNIEIIPTGIGFLPPNNHPAITRHRDAAQVGYAKALAAVTEGRHALVILDEFCLAVARGLVSEQQALDLIQKTPPNLCLVLTGRDAPQWLIAQADTVTEMRCIKHGMDIGIAAQNGVEQ
jgi:cob(I)alamin adenosyltransferase